MTPEQVNSRKCNKLNAISIFESSEASADDNPKYEEEYGYTHFWRAVTALKCMFLNHKTIGQIVILFFWVFMFIWKVVLSTWMFEMCRSLLTGFFLVTFLIVLVYQ